MQGSTLSSDTLSGLHLLNLLLLQNQHDLGERNSCEERQQTINPDGVLKHNFRINLSETTHIRIVGQWSPGFNGVTDSDNQSRTHGNGFSGGLAVSGVDAENLGSILSVFDG